jgi:acyl-[acyl-carrier-protein]-phospholipid O-acyltransferase/long-chain-fatty-acid--[acyl-carrier-protein] ligase
MLASAIYSGFTHHLHIGLRTFCGGPRWFRWPRRSTPCGFCQILCCGCCWRFLTTPFIEWISAGEHVPGRGGALLVPNHASIVDAALVIAATDRPVRFLMFKDIYEHPLIKPFAKTLGVIPISGQQRPREMIHSLREATRALQEGELVCIFPEGQMTRIGQMMPFRRGMERILKGVDVPVVPMNIDGIWGSIFSFAGGKFFWKRPRKIPYPVRVTFGKALPATVTAAEARQAAGATPMFARRKRNCDDPNHLCRRRRHPLRFAMADFRTQLKFPQR